MKPFKMHVTAPPRARPPPPPQAPSVPQKHGRDVKLPEISCDNKQLLSSETPDKHRCLFSHLAVCGEEPPPPPAHPCQRHLFDVAFSGGLCSENCFFFSSKCWSPSLLKGKTPTVLSTAPSEAAARPRHLAARQTGHARLETL